MLALLPEQVEDYKQDQRTLGLVAFTPDTVGEAEESGDVESRQTESERPQFKETVWFYGRQVQGSRVKLRSGIN